MKLADVQRVTERSITSAGPRYTPGQDSTFPNIAIREIDDVFIGVLGGKPFHDKVIGLKEALLEKFNENRRTLRLAFPGRFREPSSILNGLSGLANCRPGSGLEIISRTRRAVDGHVRTCKRFQDQLYAAQSTMRTVAEIDKSKGDFTDTYQRDNDSVRELEARIRSLASYTSTLHEVLEFLKSRTCMAHDRNCILMVGDWGSGKTHYLCDLARSRYSCAQPALMVLAKDFEPVPTVCSGLIGHTTITRNVSSLVNGLGRLAKKGERALLIIDGINESDSVAWRDSIKELINTVRRRNDVALVLSCRSPMHIGIVRSALLDKFISLQHPGFSEIEFDAQQTFFDFYDIPLPEVPLLAEEFSRPLTLKILCEAFKDLPNKTQRAGFAGISSGQRGMTTILETFIKARAREIELELNLPGGFSWKVVKGDNRIIDPLVSGIASNMAENGVNYVSRDRVVDIIEARSAIPSRLTATVFYRKLLAEGLLVENELWRPESEGGSIPVVSLPYERFGDHIVARHLLGKHLDTSSENSIRRSFYKNTPLGAIFALKRRSHYHYELQGWAEALIVEFPERVKRVLPEDRLELYFYLPKTWRSLAVYWQPFSNGLFWRHPGAFSLQTDRIVGSILSIGHEDSSRKMLDVLLAVSTKQKHCYNGIRLYNNILKLSMRGRDLLWSEYLRTRNHASSADRLVNWFERPIANLNPEIARNLISVFSLFLTTTDRKLRDRVTKILVRLGIDYPKELFEHTLHTLKFNDPYVPERMLAASYGMSMSLYADRSNKIFSKLLQGFAKQIVRRMYLSEGEFRTPHVLIREYAIGIVTLSQLVNPRCIANQWIAKIRPPFEYKQDPFINYVIEDKVSSNVNNAISMDFENYTIGRLVDGRTNYDFENDRYKEIRQKIDWRIYDLGYRSKAFTGIDRSIGSSAWRTQEGKVDRYGKKYSWIAYFEMYGILQANGQLAEHRQEERTSDCDIDPSFPKTPSTWMPPPHHFFRRHYDSSLAWIKYGPSPRFQSWLQQDTLSGMTGPWILLDGYVRDVESNAKHSAFAFLRGFLIDSENVDLLKLKVRKEDSPGSGLPNPREGAYTYAGEVPWSKHYHGESHLKVTSQANIDAEEAFTGSKRILRRSPVKKAWNHLYEELGEIPEIPLTAIIGGSEVADGRDFRVVQSAIENANARAPVAERIEFFDLIRNKPTIEELEAGYSYVEDWESVSGIPLLSTSWIYNWEPHHSVVNDFSGFRYPSPIICNSLQLTAHRRSIDLLDKHGAQATVCQKSQGDWPKGHNALYLRQDLLQELLAREKKALVWVIWGERDLTSEHAQSFYRRHDIRIALQNSDHIFKRVAVYQPT